MILTTRTAESNTSTQLQRPATLLAMGYLVQQDTLHTLIPPFRYRYLFIIP